MTIRGETGDDRREKDLLGEALKDEEGLCAEKAVWKTDLGMDPKEVGKLRCEFPLPGANPYSIAGEPELAREGYKALVAEGLLAVGGRADGEYEQLRVVG